MDSKAVRVKGIGPYLFLLPLFIGIGIFGFASLIYVFKLSLTETNLFRSEFVGFRNYIEIFQDKWFLISLGHTFYYALWSVPLNLIFGLSLALIVFQKIKFGTLFRFAYLLPWISSGIIIAFVFRYIFNPEWGIMNWFLSLFGINKVSWTASASTAIPIVGIMGAWQNMGFGMIIFLAGMSSIPHNIFEASELDGASKLQQFFKITLPLLKPTIFFYLTLSIIQSFQIFDTIYAFVEGIPGASLYDYLMSPILVSSYFIYLNAFRMMQFGRASSMAIIMFIIVLVIIAVQKKFLGKDIAVQ